MITSIQHFCENGVKNLTDIFKTYTDDLTKIAEMVYQTWMQHDSRRMGIL